MRPRPYAATIIVACTVSAACAAASLTLAVGPAAARQNTASAPSFDELYRRGRQINAGIKTLTARFTETTSSALLEDPIVERGMLFVERATPRVALRYEGTDRVLLTDADRMTTVWPSRHINYTQDIRATRRRIQGYFEDADPSELRKVFDIALRDTSERAGTYEVAMLPKRTPISETLTRLELWVDESTALLRAMRLTFETGETKLMEFEDVVPNAAIDEAAFSVPR